MHTRIHKIRNIFNMTQEEFANQIHISLSYYKKIENGSIRISKNIISKICNEFQISGDWIINGLGEMRIQHINKGNYCAEISSIKTTLLKFIWSIDDNILYNILEQITYFATSTSFDLDYDAIYKSLLINLYRQELEAEKKGIIL